MTQHTENEQKPEQQPLPEAPESAATPLSEGEQAQRTIAELEAQIAAHKDQLLRKAAEFENFKRRTEQQSIAFAKYAGENIILELLPIIDDLSRSLKSSKQQSENDPFYKGIELIVAKFNKILEAQGVRPMESVGKEFHVDFHDVMLQVPRSDIPPHTIIEEIEKGYFLHDKVIRHAKVVVSTSPVEEEVKN